MGAQTGQQERQWEQVFKLATNKAILDVSVPEPRGDMKKVVWILVDYSRQPSVSVRHYMDWDVVKVLAEEVLRGTFAQSFPGGFTEYKGSAQGPQGQPEARQFDIRFDAQRQYPYTIRIQRGLGEVIGQGAVKMVRPQESVSIVATAFDMKRLLVSVRDFILHEELVERLWARRQARPQRQAG